MLDYRLEQIRQGDIEALKSLLTDFGRWSRQQCFCSGWGYPHSSDEACISDETGAVVDQAVGVLKRSGRRNAWRAFRLWYLAGKGEYGAREAALTWRMRRVMNSGREKNRMTAHMLLALVEIGERIVMEALNA